MSEKYKIKVGDKVIMNHDYPGCAHFCKGEIGKVKRLPQHGSLIYRVKFKGRKAIGMSRHHFDLAPDQPAEKKPTTKFKVGDRVVNTSYYFKGLPKGEIGIVMAFPTYTVKFKEKKEIRMDQERLDLVTGQQATKERSGRGTVKRGIRITAREVKPDVFEIVDFTALGYGDLPSGYLAGFPRVSIVTGALYAIESERCFERLSPGDSISRERFDKLMKICKEAGERLRKINTFPKEAFEIVI
jgi:hypothetical protein